MFLGISNSMSCDFLKFLLSFGFGSSTGQISKLKLVASRLAGHVGYFVQYESACLPERKQAFLHF